MENESQKSDSQNTATEVAPPAATPIQATPIAAPVQRPTLSLDFASVAETKEMTTWAEFREGFSLEIRYVSKSELQKLSRASTTAKFNRETHQRETNLDPDKFVPKFVALVVKNWKGLTARILSDLILTDLSKIPENRLDDPIEFSTAQMTYLMKNCYDLDAFLNQVATDLSWFKPEGQDDSTKNS